ncbi:MAG: DNA cytosine methyltransferase [Ignavibacteria bacterium]|nr:DNA cytosine methyltransferase [Ignavibacteria bacterium]MBI3765181.1 DNA cytosine methyltransferase [Ignavibacteriales bacterium]
MIGIDLFAGAGGMSLGASMAGIDVRIAVEMDPYAAMTYVHNHKGVRLYNGDIRNFRKIELHSGREPTVVFGGPPCQGFSTSNQRTRSAENENNWLFKEYVRVVRMYSPDWVVFENVKGILETEDGMFVDRIIKQLEHLGYKLTHSVLNAMDFGVPQNRSRFFIVGSRHGVRVSLHQKRKKAVPITIREAFIDLPELANGWNQDLMSYASKPKSSYAKEMRQGLVHSHNHLVTRNTPVIVERYKHVPQGGNWEDIPSRLMRNYSDRTRCHTGIYYRLEPDRPSVVVGNYRKNMLIHPEEDRGLSVREAARLQSFPDSFQFKGSIGFQQQQVGNAVPPLLAKAVFSKIIELTF